MWDEITETIQTNPYLGAGLILAGSIAVALVVHFVVLRLLTKLTSRTRTTLDDQVVTFIRRPLFVTFVLVGVRFSMLRVPLTDDMRWWLKALLITIAVLLWTGAAARVGRLLLSALAAREGEKGVLQPQTLPLFNLIAKFVVFGGGIYGILLAWDVNLTAWLASAGIIGIAVGFAAKDTLSNLFAGIFIIADAPYKIGDYVIMATGERGQITDIGIRTTRMLTRDDIEVIIPNAVIGNSMIVNESGGPHPKERVRVDVGVAYGSDIDKVRAVLEDIARESPLLEEHPAPRVRFRKLGNSSLDFQLMGWIAEPLLRGRTIDQLLTAIYKRFNAEGIAIPFPQRDVWIRSEKAEEAEEEAEETKDREK